MELLNSPCLPEHSHPSANTSSQPIISGSCSRPEHSLRDLSGELLSPGSHSSASELSPQAMPRSSFSAVYHRVPTETRASPSFRMAKWNPLLAAACICAGILFSVAVYFLSRQSTTSERLFDCSAPSMELCSSDNYFLVCKVACTHFSRVSIDIEHTIEQKLSESSRKDKTVASPSAVSNSLNRLLVKVFYEADCPDSRAFFASQLGPLLTKLPRNFTNVFDFVLYPYGKAVIRADGDIDCQHGPRECDGNQAMACALFLFRTDWLRVLRFTVCFMSHIGADSVDERADSCDTQIAKEIRSCSKPNSQLGLRLLKEMGVHTRDVFGQQLSWVPWIVIGNDTSKATSRNAEVGLQTLLCKKHKLCF